MKTLTLQIPDSIDLDEHHAKMLLAGNLYERGKLTLGQAADLVGLTKRIFIEVIGKYGFSIISDSVEDLHSDIRNAWHYYSGYKLFNFSDKIGELEVLQKLYSRTVVTREIAEEYIYPLKEWIDIKEAKDKRYQRVFEQSVDKGESSIMILAMETENCIISIDDLKARKAAKILGIKVTGTLGIIYKAKQAGLIKSVRQAVNSLKQVDFRISERVEQEIIKLSGE